MNIRQAILAAADHIETNPQDFNFWKTDVPKSCGTPGCALGWIGFFGQVKSSFTLFTASNFDVGEWMGFSGSNLEFYRRMSDCSESANGSDWYKWMGRADLCANAMRAYADKYHPAAETNFARDLTARLASMPRISEEA